MGDFPSPNGLAFSPDEKYLYVDDSFTKAYWRFDVQPDGTLTNKKLLIDASSTAARTAKAFGSPPISV